MNFEATTQLSHQPHDARRSPRDRRDPFRPPLADKAGAGVARHFPVRHWLSGKHQIREVIEGRIRSLAAEAEGKRR